METNTLHDERWYRVGPLRPRLAPGTGVHRQRYRDRPWVLLREPAGLRFVRLHAEAWQLVVQFDGTRSVAEAWAASERDGAALSQTEVVETLELLAEHGLLRADAPDSDLRLRGVRQTRQARRGTRIFELLALRVPLVNPDAWVAWLLPVLGPLYGRRGLWATLAVVIAGGLALLTRGPELAAAGARLLDPTVGEIVMAACVFVAIKVLHELGHGVACKRLCRAAGVPGGVPTIGVLFIAGMPIPYVDASAAWALPSKRDRATVGAAGMLVEAWLAALAAFVFAATGDGVLHTLAFQTMAIAGIATLAFNGNPLMRFDGYYVLSDLLEIPNLFDRSRAYLAFLARRLVGAPAGRDPSHEPGERPWLVVYAVASAIYRAVVVFWILYLLSSRWLGLGAALAWLGVVAWGAWPVARGVRNLIRGAGPGPGRTRIVTTLAAGTAAIAAFVAFVPVADDGRAEGLVEPRKMLAFHPRDAGFVERVLASGTRVGPDGPPLFVLRNEVLLEEQARIHAELGVARVELGGARGVDPARQEALRRNVAVLEASAEALGTRIAELAPRAPFEGTWVSPDGEQWLGRFVAPGDRQALGMIVGEGAYVVRAITDQRLGPRVADELPEGTATELRLVGRPGRRIEAVIEAIVRGGQDRLPSAALGEVAGGAVATERGEGRDRRTREPVFEIRLAPDWPPGLRLFAHERAVVRFRLAPKPLLTQWRRAFDELLQRRGA